ncbi:MAG TPA: hemerythrin domain-containing protein [Acidobacteriota bacterium]|nr:hemerythrin domain-containing protein [Acidobacteriota bacterium]
MEKLSISEYIENDHDRLNSLLDQYFNQRDSDLKRAINSFLIFKSYLLRHIEREERILFPLYEQKTGKNDGPTASMRLEHQKAYLLLEKLQSKIQAHKFGNNQEEQTLLIQMGQHQLKEENAIYPVLDQLLNDEEKLQVFKTIQNNPGIGIDQCALESQCESSFPLILPGK